jgi:hypothetical protein
MNITIQQRPYAFRSEYEISMPGCIYSARNRLFSWRDDITLTGPRDRILARIIGRFSPLSRRHDFELSDARVYQYNKKKIWRGVSVCEGENESFTLYEHKGLNYSIFQNDVQIAAFTRNSVKIGKGDCYEIAMNDDANLVVVICLVLTVDASENEDDNSTLTYDFGIVGPEEKPFDASWRPS